LAFAVAANLESEILVIDEVLAVGDAEFQKKCLGKMDEVSKAGRTVLFVSHNMQAIKQLCNKFIYLKDGAVVEIGDSEEVISNYLMGGQDIAGGKEQVKDVIKNLPKDSVFNLINVELKQNGHDVFDLVENGSDLYINIQHEVFKKTSGLRIYFDLVDEYETLLFRSFHDEDNDDIPVVLPGKYNSQAIIPKNLLAPTLYKVKIYSTLYNVRALLPAPIIFSFHVDRTGLANRAYLSDPIRGKLAPLIEWKVETLEESK